jgi:hypothetical protein
MVASVRRALVGEPVRIEFAPTGLVCEFHVPLQPTTRKVQAMRN